MNFRFSIYVFNTLLEHARDQKDFGKARELHRLMLAQGVKPNKRSFCLMLKASMQAGLIVSHDVFDEYLRHFTPDVIFCNIWIK